MCPYCKEHEGKGCELTEKPDGRIVCACGKHSWPNSAAFLETMRRENLKVVGMVHTWTQSY